MTIKESDRDPQDPIRILALDTTAKECSICIMSNGSILSEYNFLSRNDLSSKLVVLIDFVLREAGFKLSDIDCFGIATGPGIFTGIRVGMATLKGLLFDRKISIVPVNTLMAIHSKFSNYSNKLLALRDAKRGQVYVAGYEYSEHGVHPFQSPALMDMEELLVQLDSDSAFGFAGCGARAYREAILQKLPTSSIFTGSNFLAAEIAAIAFREFQAGRFEGDIEKIFPLYIRKTDAEENYERNRIDRRSRPKAATQ